MDVLLFAESITLRRRIAEVIARTHHVARAVETERDAVRAIARHAFTAVLVATDGKADDALYGRMRATQAEPRPVYVAMMEGASAAAMKAALDAGADDVLTTSDDAELDVRLPVIERHARERAHLVPMTAIASGLAHHIRNPLNGAVIQLEIALRGIPVADVPAMRAALSAAKRDLHRIGHLATALVSCAEARRPARREIDVVGLAREAIVHACETIDASPARVHLIEPAGALFASVDPVRVGAAIASVVTNALEAATDAGQVVMRLESDGKTLFVQIENSGKAHAPEVEPFLPFSTSKASALGLGLPTARRIAIDHGGDIHLGRDGGRTIATLALPLEPAPMP